MLWYSSQGTANLVILDALCMFCLHPIVRSCRTQSTPLNARSSHFREMCHLCGKGSTVFSRAAMHAPLHSSSAQSRTPSPGSWRSIRTEKYKRYKLLLRTAGTSIKSESGCKSYHKHVMKRRTLDNCHTPQAKIDDTAKSKYQR